MIPFIRTINTSYRLPLWTPHSPRYGLICILPGKNLWRISPIPLIKLKTGPRRPRSSRCFSRDDTIHPYDQYKLSFATVDAAQPEIWPDLYSSGQTANHLWRISPIPLIKLKTGPRRLRSSRCFSRDDTIHPYDQYKLSFATVDAAQPKIWPDLYSSGQKPVTDKPNSAY